LGLKAAKLKLHTAAGTPNQAGIGGFLTLSTGNNSVWFLDSLASVNFADHHHQHFNPA